MIETPKGVLQAAEIAAASENVVCLVMGTSDLTNEFAPSIRREESQCSQAWVQG